jgi:CRP-like cAMP-binding protein
LPSKATPAPAPTDVDVDVLRRARWFAGLPADLQQRIVGDSVVRHLARGTWLFRQGEPARGLFGLLGGRTRHLCTTSDGSEVLMHLGAPGVWTGEYAVVSGQPAVSGVVADAPCRVLFLPLARWQQMVDEQPRWMRHFAELVAERYALAFRMNADAQALAPEAWLHSRLWSMVEVERGRDARAEPARLTLSQAQLATMIGVSRQTLSLQLGRLQAQGKLRVGYRRIELLG